jgi:hypothetical protein
MWRFYRHSRELAATGEERNEPPCNVHTGTFSTVTHEQMTSHGSVNVVLFLRCTCDSKKTPAFKLYDK